MPELNMDDEGYLVDAEGKRFEVEGEPVKVGNAKTTSQVENAIKERLARQNDKIKALEAQANRTPELEKLLNDLKEEKTSLEEQLSNAKKQAQDEVASQINKLTSKAKELEAKLAEESSGRIRDQVTTAILAKAGDRFINPAEDVVPKLLSVHKREPAKDDQGKTVDGKFVDVFTVRYKNDKGEEVEEALPVDKALDVMASKSEYAHYVRGTSHGGSGGGTYVNVQNLKRSTMSVSQKTEFISKHGEDAFKKLPE